MNLFRFLRKKTISTSPSPGSSYIFGGGDGSTINSAVKVMPARIEDLRRMFKAKLGDNIPTELAATPNAIDGLIAEMGKMVWLESRFGKENSAGWKCGTRRYLSGSVQSQELLLRDGRSLTMFFDFSEFHPHGW